MNRLKVLFSIFILTFSTTLLEVAYTRVFSVVYFGQFAFFIISLALFGFGLSGVYLSLRRIHERPDAISWLERFMFLYCAVILITYKITLNLTVDFLNLFHPFHNFLFLIVNFVVILALFFFAGVSLALIFSIFSEQIGKLYFIDLVGAALGSLAVVPLIPQFGPSRTIALLFLLLAVAWLFISTRPWRVRGPVFLLLLAVFAGAYHWQDSVFRIVPKISKRLYNIQLFNNRIEYSKWSTINKIDVAPSPFAPPQKTIWINGGTQQSFIREMAADFEKKIAWDNASLPFQLRRRGSAVIIGSAGGWEVLCALSHDFKPIVAIEMDPVICDIVKNRYAEYGGNIFNRPQVKLIADEGRSTLKRLKQKFDVIQMVNSHNTDMLLAGGLSIAESYIYTVESFKEYWDKLNDGGYIYIVHSLGERMFATALQALREMNVPHPERKFCIIQSRNAFNFFILKKGDITIEDTELLRQFMNRDKDHNKEFVYSPLETRENVYYSIVRYGDAFIRRSSVNIAPTYDISPYFNLTNRIGQFSFHNMYVQGMARDLVKTGLLYSNSIYLSILGLSLLFSFLFIVLPLRRRPAGRAHLPIIGYFFLIGLAFIMVEIIYIKIFQLFLGSPAISISIILFSILVSSSLGSLMSERLTNWMKGRSIPFFALFIAVLLGVYAFVLFPLLNQLISVTYFVRLLLTFVLVFLSGFFMGTFFPYGIRFLGRRDRSMIGWAWGANAFATVLGSILTVIISINFNFRVVLFMAAVCYLAAGLALLLEERRHRAA